MSPRRAISLVAWPRDPRAAAQRRLSLVDRDHARHRRRLERVADGAPGGDDVSRRGGCASARRARRRVAAPRSRSTRRCGSRSCRRQRLGATSWTPEKVDVLLLLGDDRIVFRKSVDTQLAAADTAVRALRRHLPPAPEARDRDAEPRGRDFRGHRGCRRHARRRASPRVASDLRPVGTRRCGREKSNRVVELILSTVRPRHLLVGKVVGIGLLGLTQLALVAGLAAVLLAAGVYDAPLIARPQRRAGGSVVRARVRALCGRLRHSRRARGATAGRELGWAAGDLHAAGRVLRRLRSTQRRRG